MEKVKLTVVGITYSQVHQDAYALILAEEDGPFRIPIVVGVAEAQSIAVRLESVIPPRPLPHDVMVALCQGFGISLDEVFIYKFEEGIFLSELHMSSNDRQISIDSRTSDAIALAMRTGAPIYATREVVEQTGFIVSEETQGTKGKGSSRKRRAVLKKEPKLTNLSIPQLEKMLAACVEREEYERAGEIKAEIDRKRNE